ncbi:hypothetical protein GUITHDRAFT_109434 [Guillardia theta CCMP2712]|uniref:Uncharacterized protein n=1 Tax=Guillardia theta (strain CCMP2712) TaxID=905079 RepID=L1J8I9_GUITC|nr:hypothetical protein GUITHDRAFT_109434 [Guillardia theta CCMP2712]EKX44657.1 hypothetical protein GUITHDRAFT_109434 [Guillardia theta CCMP2712]|eukprot:XP_005831637.1 hypothetical protein GUITHDRAFT_109434 [Guillardia theta CCMP2712]
METCEGRRREEKMMEAMAGWIEASEIQADLLRQLDELTSRHAEIESENGRLREETRRLRLSVGATSSKEASLSACRELISLLGDVQKISCALADCFLHSHGGQEHDGADPAWKNMHAARHDSLESDSDILGHAQHRCGGDARAHDASSDSLFDDMNPVLVQSDQQLRPRRGIEGQSWAADMSCLLEEIREFVDEISLVRETIDDFSVALQADATVLHGRQCSTLKRTSNNTRVAMISADSVFGLQVCLLSLSELVSKSYGEAAALIDDVGASMHSEVERCMLMERAARETWEENIRLRQEMFAMSQQLDRMQEALEGAMNCSAEHERRGGEKLSADDLRRIAEETVLENIKFRHQISDMSRAMEHLQEFADGVRAQEMAGMGREETRQIAEVTVRENILLRQEIYTLSCEVRSLHESKRKREEASTIDQEGGGCVEEACACMLARMQDLETLLSLIGISVEQRVKREGRIENRMFENILSTVSLIEIVLTQVGSSLDFKLNSVKYVCRQYDSHRTAGFDKGVMMLDVSKRLQTSDGNDLPAQNDVEKLNLMDVMWKVEESVQSICIVLETFIEKSYQKAFDLDQQVDSYRMSDTGACRELLDRGVEGNARLSCTKESSTRSNSMIDPRNSNIEGFVNRQESVIVTMQETLQGLERAMNRLGLMIFACRTRSRETVGSNELLQPRSAHPGMSEGELGEGNLQDLQQRVEEAESRASRAQLQAQVLQKKLMATRLLAARQRMDLHEDVGNMTTSTFSSYLAEDTSSSSHTRPTPAVRDPVLRDWERACARWEQHCRIGLKGLFAQRSEYQEICMFLHAEVIPLLSFTASQPSQTDSMNQKLIACVVEGFFESIPVRVDTSNMKGNWMDLLDLKTLLQVSLLTLQHFISMTSRDIQVLLAWIKEASDRDYVFEAIALVRRSRSLPVLVVDSVETEIKSLIGER